MNIARFANTCYRRWRHERYAERSGDLRAEARHRDGAAAGHDADARPDVLHDILAFIYRYVVLTVDQAVAITLWVAHTHAIRAADCTAYFQVTSATAEAGKTRLLETLDLLVAAPWLTGRTSAAALVRKVDADSPTLLLDESDAAFNGEKEYAEALRGILNTGYRRSGKSTLCIGQGANLTFRDFSTFCPKAIAGIGKLPDTVVSRAIRIELRRRTKAEPVAKFRERDARSEADPIRAALLTWASDRTVATLKTMRPLMPAGLRDRAEDVLEPLFAIADLAGGEWPEAARTAAVALMGSTSDQDINIELLYDIFTLFNASSADVHQVRRPRQEASRLGRSAVGRLEARQANHDAGGRGPAEGVRDRAGEERTDDRGYYRDRFEDAWTRYPPLKPSNRRNPNEDGPEVAISNRRNRVGSDALKMQENSITTGPFDGSTVRHQGNEDQGTDDGLPADFVPPMGISREAWLRQHVRKEGLR